MAKYHTAADYVFHVASSHQEILSEGTGQVLKCLLGKEQSFNILSLQHASGHLHHSRRCLPPCTFYMPHMKSDLHHISNGQIWPVRLWESLRELTVSLGRNKVAASSGLSMDRSLVFARSWKIDSSGMLFSAISRVPY